MKTAEIFLGAPTVDPLSALSAFEALAQHWPPDGGGGISQQRLRPELAVIATNLAEISLPFILFFKFIFGCIGSSLLRAGFLYLRRAGATLRCGGRASHCGGFSCCRAQAPGAWASVVVAHRLSSCGWQALERRLSSCSARA